MKIRSAALGTTVLVVLLTAGAAQSLSGSNTVYTDDIVAGQVMGSDLAANAVSGSKIYPNSVTSVDIAANGVGASELASNAVNSSKVADNSITGADILDNSVAGGDISGGIGGHQLEDGLVYQTSTVSGSIPAGEAAYVTAYCADSDMAIGAAFTQFQDDAFHIRESALLKNTDSGLYGWTIRAHNTSDSEDDILVRALCMKGIAP